MSPNLPALPRPETLTLAEARDVCASVVQWANDQEDIETVLAAKQAFNVVAEYLRLNDAAREAETTMRYLEVRIGELLGPAQVGRPSGNLTHALNIDLNHARVHEFRQMAAHPDVVDRVIEESSESSPPSRSKVLNAIRELKRAADEANAEAQEWNAGLQEQREWAATVKPKDGDDWKRRNETQLALAGLVYAVKEFGKRATPDDVEHALATGLPHVSERFRTGLAECLELLQSYRKAWQ
jgi:hypothetical protein